MKARQEQPPVGITYVEGRLRGPVGGEASLRFLVDSAATYTVVPDPVWRELGIQRKQDITLQLADGSTIAHIAGDGHITLDAGDGTSPVILGQPGDFPLLGVVTLEVIGLVFNPLIRTLHPMRMLMA